MSDYLSSLPVELFEDIIRLVQEDAASPQLYVSKAFLPFVREPLFKTIKLQSFPSLKSFVQLIKSSPLVAQYVDTLEIDMLHEHDATEPKNKSVKSFFTALDHLEHLEIKHSSRLAQLVLSPSTRILLPRMMALKVTSTFEGWENPLDPNHFKSLTR